MAGKDARAPGEGGLKLLTADRLRRRAALDVPEDSINDPDRFPEG
jgi:hypothetical protein